MSGNPHTDSNSDSESESGPIHIADLGDFKAYKAKPPCNCGHCLDGWYVFSDQKYPSFWYRGIISDESARETVTRYVQDAQEDRKYLLQRLVSQADTIVNRWRKKGRAKRRALLGEIAPDLCERRWLMPRYCYMPESDQGCQPGGRDPVHRSQLLLHWLSVEVLVTNPVVFFALLHNRTAYSAQDWASWDGDQLADSWSEGYFDVEYSSKCVVMRGPFYGELVDWEPGPAHRGEILGFPKARLILEAQAYLLGILRKIVDRILNGIDLSKTTASEKWNEMTKAGFRQTDQVEAWSPYTNQPFSAPPVFSIDHLISIAQTRTDAMGDHLWLLQADPAYMRRYIRLICQGNCYKQLARDFAGALVSLQMWLDFITHREWVWFKSECEYVKSVSERVGNRVLPCGCLPEEYNKALGGLEYLASRRVGCWSHGVWNLARERPGFSRNWDVRFRFDHEVFEYQEKIPMMTEDIFSKDPLEWCLCEMPRRRRDVYINLDIAQLFAFLEHHLSVSDRAEKERVDELLYRKLSDLAAVHEMWESVRLHRPRHTSHMDINEILKSRDRPAWKIEGVTKSVTMKEYTRLGRSLLQDFYDAPWPNGQKSLLWIARSQNIRKALENFWAKVRVLCRQSLGTSNFTENEICDVLAVISVHETREYIDSVQQEEESILEIIQTPSVSATTEVQEQWLSDNSIEPSQTPARREKIKTRPAEVLTTGEGIAHAAATPTTGCKGDKGLKVYVTKRSYDMLTLMFPASGEESTKGMKWDMFVHAMLDIGFSARNAGGSAVVFENGNGKIIFHKPHPTPNLDSVMLHSMGRRMAKWFGWRREVFELEA
ncbi:hypothetical protein AJ80_07736 [Polytolypa hystricis UAMH7299]|uniref:Uncharacterized protein n=1 Tax=Polytolypa hystricis (strain UAMH7299) TaxID=1447883 RepID=A0A2B7XIV5_POLH7|nr:hypothetical protein AJ80_07736 [Polytolypa hystricis UAMH7299]